ncbi:MAG TPA: hypothetical protein VGE57_07050 [Solimonas sp.]
MLLRFAVLAAVLGLAACGSNRHCQGDHPYQRAQTLPPPAPIEGLKWPESPSALRIPPAPAQAATPYAYQDGDAGLQCLDVPPRMPPEPAAAPAASAADKPANK